MWERLSLAVAMACLAWVRLCYLSEPQFTHLGLPCGPEEMQRQRGHVAETLGQCSLLFGGSSVCSAHITWDSEGAGMQHGRKRPVEHNAADSGKNSLEESVSRASECPAT